MAMPVNEISEKGMAFLRLKKTTLICCRIKGHIKIKINFILHENFKYDDK